MPSSAECSYFVDGNYKNYVRLFSRIFYGLVAQLEEQGPSKSEVRGSSPLGPTNQIKFDRTGVLSHPGGNRTMYKMFNRVYTVKRHHS